MTRLGSLDAFPDMDMRHETIKGLYHYWNDLRGERIAPRRFEIEPSRIGDFLPDTFILERSAKDHYAFRLAGTRLAERFGTELRGRSLTSCFDARDAATLTARLDQAASQGGALLLSLEAHGPRSAKCAFEMIILPLIHMQPSPDRFLGAASALAQPGWLGHDPVTKLEIEADEVIWPDGRPHAVVASVDRQVPFLPHIRTARIVRQDRRQFRVYDGGLTARSGEDS